MKMRTWILILDYLYSFSSVQTFVDHSTAFPSSVAVSSTGTDGLFESMAMSQATSNHVYSTPLATTLGMYMCVYGYVCLFDWAFICCFVCLIELLIISLLFFNRFFFLLKFVYMTKLFILKVSFSSFNNYYILYHIFTSKI